MYAIKIPIVKHEIFAPSLRCSSTVLELNGFTNIITNRTHASTPVPRNEATDTTESECPVGSEALVDEDDGQKGGSFGRLIGVIYCDGNDTSLNEVLLQADKAVVYEDFCEVSEFANEDWVTRFGCEPKYTITKPCTLHCICTVREISLKKRTSNVEIYYSIQVFSRANFTTTNFIMTQINLRGVKSS